MTRLALAVALCALLAATATAVAASRGLQPVVHPRVVNVTASTDDLSPLLDASIAAAHQAADVCEKP